MPHYKPKQSGRYVLTFTTQAISAKALRRGELVLSGLNVCIRTKRRRIDQVRVVPCASHYLVEVVYTKPVEPLKLDKTLYAGVDVGVDVLAALASNKPGFVPFLVNGRPLKALNQAYNKRNADWQSQLPEGKHTSKRIAALTFARNRRIDYLLHLASTYIIRALLLEGIGNLVIGKNDGWKQGVSLGKATNQTFVSIPHARFIDMLTYKAELVGIRVKVIEENYTSKCSFLDNELLGKHETYLGKRVKRGLFRASDGQTIQADLNAAYNLIRKVAPNAFAEGRQVTRHGLRLNPTDLEMHLQMWNTNEVEGRIPNRPDVVPLGSEPIPEPIVA